MTRYFRVLQTNFLWDEGAIISNKDDTDRYVPISTVWNHSTETGSEYISAPVIEAKDNADMVQEVWPISKLEKMLFGTKKQAQASAAALYMGGK